MKNEKHDNNQSNNNWWHIIIVGLIIFALSYLFHKVFQKKSKPKTYSKADLVKLYQVDIKTINKWVKIFCDQNKLPYEDYKRKRKLPEDIYYYIIECLGTPSNETPVMSKFQIITNGDDMMGNEYRGARNSVKLNAHSDLIIPKIYATFNVFPPKIAQLLQEKIA